MTPPTVELDEPALPLTIQTTIPVLTTLLFTLSLAMIGFIVSVQNWESFSLPILGSPSKDVALMLLSLSAFLFLFTATGCVKAHAWDYYSISPERRTEERLATTDSYINKCWNYSWVWYKVAIWSYSLGVIFLLLGTATLFWKVSKFTSILSIVCLIMPLLIKAADVWFSRKLTREQKRKSLFRRLLGDTYRT
jgi:hypothetical protein